MDSVLATVTAPTMITQAGLFVAPVVLLLVIGLGRKLAPWFAGWVKKLVTR